MGLMESRQLCSAPFVILVKVNHTSAHSRPKQATVQAAVVVKACDTELVNVYPENM